MKIVTINKNDSGQRVDKFLGKLLPTMPRSLLYKQLRNKRVKRNKKALSAQDVLATGDELYLYINDEFFQEKEVVTTGGDGLSVVYEDENILVADKPMGQASHGDGDSLLTQIQGYLYKKGEFNPEEENTFSPSLCNRIDRNTRGLVLAAKNAEALKTMNEKIKNGEVRKEYLCAIHGEMEQKSGRLEHFLLSSETENRVRVVKPGTKGAKNAALSYRVLKTGGGLSLLGVTLFTGRKHQIRVQFSAVGHPLLGDTKYGAPKDSRYRYQALCAYRLTFTFRNDDGPLAYLKDKTLSLKEDIFEDLF